MTAFRSLKPARMPTITGGGCMKKSAKPANRRW
nr:MAG TPA: hypothetical protein [Caudoviricetes sp.]